MGDLTPPSVLLTWDPTSLAADFGGYRVYRRPSRAPARSWTLIGRLDVPDGRTPATVETLHAAFVDRTAGWSTPGGPYETGWDYAVTVLDGATGLESAVAAATAARVDVPRSATGWITSNEAPWLCAPIDLAETLDAGSSHQVDVYHPVGRDRAVTRTRSELPGRRWDLSWRYQAGGEDAARATRAAAQSARQVTGLTAWGDRLEGTLTHPTVRAEAHPYATADAELIETAADPAVAEYNLACGAVFDGAANYAATSHAADLNPDDGAFTVLGCGLLTDGSGALVTKGNLGVSAGYGLAGGVPGGFGLIAAGTTGTAFLFDIHPDWFTQTRVAAASSDGTTQRLYRDGVQVAAGSTEHGTIANSVDLTAAANNGGAGGHMATSLCSWAYYPRELTPAEHRAAAGYLLGHAGARMPAGAVVFYDLRDDRCWDARTTTLTCLAGPGRPAELVGAPPARGFPWPLHELERWS